MISRLQGYSRRGILYIFSSQIGNLMFYIRCSHMPPLRFHIVSEVAGLEPRTVATFALYQYIISTTMYGIGL